MTDRHTASSLSAQLSKILIASPDDMRASLSFRTRLTYSVRIRRIEFLPLFLTVPLVPALLVADSWQELLSLNVGLAAVATVLAIQAGTMTNCLADREMDAVYKTGLSRAVYALGVSAVVRQIAATCAVCAVLGVYLSVATHHLDLLLIGVVWAVLGVGYSLPPLRLNGRGIWQLPTLFAYFILPGTLMLRTFGGPIDWGAVVAVCGFSLTNLAILVVNHAEDLPEDELYSIRTYVRALGLTVALALGVVMVLVGAALTVGFVYSTIGLSWGDGALPSRLPARDVVRRPDSAECSRKADRRRRRRTARAIETCTAAHLPRRLDHSAVGGLRLRESLTAVTLARRLTHGDPAQTSGGLPRGSRHARRYSSDGYAAARE